MSKQEEEQLKSLYSNLENLTFVTLAFQSRKATLSTVRYIFDEVIAEFPLTVKYLSTSGRSIYNRSFESRFIKIQEGSTAFLGESEKFAVSIFEKM